MEYTPCELHDLIGCVLCHPATPITIHVHFHATDRAQRPSGNRREWDAFGDEVARDLDFTDAEVAELVGRTIVAVSAYRLYHGIRDPHRQRVVDQSAERAMARWTPTEIEFVREHMDDTEPAGIAHALGRTPVAVKAMIHKIRQDFA